MTGTIDPPCGVPAHRMGRWEDVVLGVWWCPDCGEETWVTEGVDGEQRSDDRTAPPAGAGTVGARRPGAVPVPDLRDGAAEPGHYASAPGNRAPGVGWRDRDGGARLWSLILEAFGRAAE